ncbi:Fc receptor-like A [Polypterus senegalus]|uniref:Fc receptor-like A n=1 Tax=Polypterus senegalus TaxID=55291 RepID=UPI001966C102|nr:Fc receptor-like A [Polypterus senegalus]
MWTCECYLFIGLTLVMISARDNNKPNVTLTLKNDEKSVYIGNEVTLECSIDGKFTDLTYHFYRGDDRKWGSEIKASKENTYTIKSVTQSDSGVYHCNFYRDNPPYFLLSRSNPVTLTVQVPSLILTASPGGFLTEKISLTLTCTWKGNGSLNSNSNFTFWRDGMIVRNSSSFSVFQIKHIDKHHAGCYTCTTELQGGVTEHSNRLEVKVQGRKKNPNLHGP